jgi:hypothetical protein
MGKMQHKTKSKINLIFRNQTSSENLAAWIVDNMDKIPKRLTAKVYNFLCEKNTKLLTNDYAHISR